MTRCSTLNGATTLSIETLSIMTLSIMSLSIATLSIMTLSITTLRIKTLSITTLGIILLSCVSFMLSVNYAKCHKKPIMPSVVMHNIDMLNVVAPSQ